MIVLTSEFKVPFWAINLMFRGVISVRQNNLNPVLAKILIKEMENFAQLVDCGID